MVALYVLMLFSSMIGWFILLAKGGRILRGNIDQCYRGIREYRIADNPFRFLGHATGWVTTSLAFMLVGCALIGEIDPWLLVMPPLLLLAGRSAFATMELVGGRSNDDGRGSIEALEGPRRAALSVRVKSLVEGSERRMFNEALEAWTHLSEEDGYRGRGDPQRGARFDAFLAAAAKERRRFLRRLTSALYGLIPGVVFAIQHEELRTPAIAWWSAASCLAVSLGGVAFVFAACRRIDRLAAEARVLVARARDD